MSERLVGPRARLADGTRIAIEVDGIEIGVFEHAGTVFAFENRCPHQGGPVCEGTVLGAVRRVFDDAGRDRGGTFAEDEIHLVCPWHGWEYDLATGRSIAYPSLALRRFDVTEREGDVYVEL
jgi:nitrite reductase/ring-hydroxylating ferredoxin subunit